MKDPERIVEIPQVVFEDVGASWDVGGKMIPFPLENDAYGEWFVRPLTNLSINGHAPCLVLGTDLALPTAWSKVQLHPQQPKERHELQQYLLCINSWRQYTDEKWRQGCGLITNAHYPLSFNGDARLLNQVVCRMIELTAELAWPFPHQVPVNPT